MSLMFTEEGLQKVEAYIEELKAKRKEILDAGLDTATDELPTAIDILTDIEFIGFDEDGEYFNGWAVTDEYDADAPISLREEIEDTYCAIDYNLNSFANFGIHIPKKNKINAYVNILTDEFASIRELITFIANSEIDEYCLQSNFRGMGFQSLTFVRLLNRKYNEKEN